VPNQRDRLRVLIVDDEPTIADTLAQILDASGFEAKAVYYGEAAVAAAEQFQPDILLTDVIMRGMSGIDAGVCISKAVPHCRVILFSGQASTADLLHQAEAKGYRFEILAKPIHPRELVKVLSSPQNA